MEIGTFAEEYPIPEWSVEHILLRDWFAGMALQGMYAGKATTTDGDTGGYAKAAYFIADAMLSEREE